MAGYGYVLDAVDKKTTSKTQEQFTIGRVIDTNDPQQMGRVRAFCPAFGDKEEFLVEDIPWSMYVSPLGGMTSFGKRGSDQSQNEGPVAYGMWNIPKVGAYVLVGCLDGDPGMRFYAGCIHPQYLTHTMPHGRFTWNDNSADGTPDGPVDTNENPIEPLYSKQTQQFTKRDDTYAAGGTPSDPRRNMEYRSRAVDNQVSAITNLHVNHPNDAPGSFIADHDWGNFSFTTVTEENGDTREIEGPGYGRDQLQPEDNYTNTGGVNYDSMVYSWTTPGFHSFSMDDRDKNSRIRIRTTSGHQIIMDDTNERIYISTAGGESWIELDQAGNIDIYASKDISTHAGGDINFTTDKTFRVKAQEGIHMISDDAFRMHSYGRFDVRVEDEMYIEVIGDTHMRYNANWLVEVASNTDINIGSVLKLATGSDTNINTGGKGFWTTANEMHHLAGATMFFTGGSDIHLNGPPAQGAQAADSAQNAYFAFLSGRVPDHEPWARIFSDPATADQDTTANTFTPFPADYTSADVGKKDREGTDYGRNPFWHR